VSQIQRCMVQNSKDDKYEFLIQVLTHDMLAASSFDSQWRISSLSIMSCGGRKLELDCHMEQNLVKCENLEKFEYKMFHNWTRNEQQLYSQNEVSRQNLIKVLYLFLTSRPNHDLGLQILRMSLMTNSKYDCHYYLGVPPSRDVIHGENTQWAHTGSQPRRSRITIIVGIPSHVSTYSIALVLLY
jgi:hypothetical protein